MRNPYKTICWKAENEINLALKINKNQDPELYELICNAQSKSGLIRDLMREGYQLQLKALNDSLK